MDLKFIYELSIKEKKSQLERFAKLVEESGELAQEILIDNQASGFAHKAKGADGIKGEAADVLTVAFSIFFKAGGSIEELENILQKKCAKWSKHQA